jgi:phosphoribosyl 1,2-cyclic phosphodiesterase
VAVGSPNFFPERDATLSARFCSSGNSTYLCAGGTRLLVDAGLPAQVIARGLATLDVSVGEIDGILISHEHTDHLRGAALLARKYDLPIYTNRGTATQLAQMLPSGSAVRPLAPDGTLFGHLRVHYFSVPHDAIAPIGFVFEHHGIRIGMATDLGCLTPEVEEALAGCHAIILESNHDEVMLATGRYPEFLKARIRSPIGHLSNRQAAEVLRVTSHRDLQHIVLAHLSRENNDPVLARETVAAEFSDDGCPSIHLTSQYEVGPFLEIG